MFIKAAIILTSLSLVLANPIVERGGPPPPPPSSPPPPTAPPPQPITVNQCDTGNLQCCNTMSSTSDPSTASLLGLLGVVVQGLGIPIGLGCTPISVIGVASGASCSQSPVCCNQTVSNSGSLIGINCNPVTL